MITELDPRLHAFDPDARVAEDSLRALLPEPGWSFVSAWPAQAGAERLSLRAAPDPEAAQVSEALPGEGIDRLWDGPDGWVYVRVQTDGYLGWARAAGLVDAGSADTSLQVTALRAHAFAGPKISRPIRAELCLGSVLGRGEGEVVEENLRRWVPVVLPGGAAAWVQEVTVSPLPDGDPADLRADLKAELALRFLETPYVWGGRSAWGLDCSGLTQVVSAAFGHAIPRDADQQQEFLTPVARPQRGDLVFFPGHVGLMLDERRLVHANATHMRVTVETLGEGAYGQRLEASCTGFGRWNG
ncbi:C40 family peptidase [Deinococcus koreensis]|uniref:Peptidase n=1 Tax=Deinococcus koreensis TaxID=2054903 RepID=A0A2K3UTW4_9DEIO|nr:C40 family peptidase [Deinococcus koreensis]PNY79979.1 peptidase [Deinococcus koreensis]